MIYNGKVENDTELMIEVLSQRPWNTLGNTKAAYQSLEHCG